MAEHAVDLTNGEHDEEVEDLNEEARSSLSLPPVLKQVDSLWSSKSSSTSSLRLPPSSLQNPVYKMRVGTQPEHEVF